MVTYVLLIGNKWWPLYYSLVRNYYFSLMKDGAMICILFLDFKYIIYVEKNFHDGISLSYNQNSVLTCMASWHSLAHCWGRHCQTWVRSIGSIAAWSQCCSAELTDPSLCWYPSEGEWEILSVLETSSAIFSLWDTQLYFSFPASASHTLTLSPLCEPLSFQCVFGIRNYMHALIALHSIDYLHNWCTVA